MLTGCCSLCLTDLKYKTRMSTVKEMRFSYVTSRGGRGGVARLFCSQLEDKHSFFGLANGDSEGRQESQAKHRTP